MCSRGRRYRLALAALALAGLAATGARIAAAAPQPVTTHAFSILSGAGPRVLFRGSEVKTPFTVRNDGFLTWEQDAGISFSYHWLSITGERLQRGAFRNKIPARAPGPIGPGETLDWNIRVKPPPGIGLYRLQFDMVEEKVCWFSERDSTPEPARWVIVLPSPAFVFTLLLPLVAAIAGLLLVRRSRLPRHAGALEPAAFSSDLLWCGLSLFGAPYLLYDELSVRFALRGIGVMVSTVALVLLLLLPWSRRARPWLCWGAAAFAALFVWGHTLYFRFFGDVISVAALAAVHQTSDLGEAIRYLAQPRDLWLPLNLAAALPLVVSLSRLGLEPRRSRRWLRPLTAALLIAALIPGLGAAVRALGDAEAGRRNLLTLRSVASNGIYGYQLGDIAARAGRPFARSSVTDEELAGLVDWFARRAPERAGTEPWFGHAAGKSLLAIQVESMQQFVLDLEIDGQEITPNLNRLAASALVFPKVQDQTSRGRSSAGDFVNMTSILPLGESPAYEFPANDFHALGRALADHGYATLSAIPYKGYFWNRHATHPAYGFRENLFREAFEKTEKVGWGLNDRDFLRQMRPRLEALPRPFAAWLTTLSLHYPYTSFPEHLKVLDLGRLEGSALGNYLHGMSYFDRAFAELAVWLEESSLVGEVVVALWGDHGSGLLQKQGVADQLGVDTEGAQRFVMDRVPLLIWVPGEGAPRGRSERQAGQVDITPTLLALLGIDPAPLAHMGRNLLGAPSAEPTVHPRGRWIDESHVFLDHGEEEGGTCFDAASLRRLRPAACRPGSELARRQLEVANLLLEFDLQETVSKRLEERLEEQPAEVPPPVN